MVVKSKRLAQPGTVPQTREQVVEAIAELGRRMRERTRLESEMNDAMAVVKERFAEAAAPIDVAIRSLTDGVQVYAEAHRDELTERGRTKTVRLPSGEIKWRMTPPSVSVRGVQEVMRRLIGAGLERMIRLKSEVNKEAVLAEPDAVRGIDGISISQVEEIVIEPFESVLEEVA